MTSDAAALWLAPLPAAFTFSQARELGTPIRSLYALRDRAAPGAVPSPPGCSSWRHLHKAGTPLRRWLEILL